MHALLSSVLIHSFRLQSPEHSCSSLRDAQCIAFDEPVRYRGVVMLCFAELMLRECTVFSKDTISYYNRKLALIVMVKGAPAFSY